MLEIDIGSKPREQPVKAHVCRPTPDCQRMRAVFHREEHHFCRTNQIFKGYKSDVESAVERIVPVVAHHEIMSGRYFKHIGVVPYTVNVQIQCIVGNPVWKRFGKDRDFNPAPEIVLEKNPLGSRLTAVPLMTAQTVLHLDFVTGEADNAFDVVDIRVIGQFENCYFTTFGLTGPNSSFEQVR